ncbi:hypothetical protein M5J14_23285 [Lysinibacillus sp. OL1_EC]|uniref:hypothetical protein n=1 Tax=unclassified Lysinibacillus TaxID=2636778 RepID=UPI00103DF228|nr:MULTISPECIES: hypothetical protein [unclassified Lysinibacillus]MCM0627407.1 hypothetical protein [Lysinibacillus sp. OL1_EC]TBV84858.1 hypothetical protein EW028_23845 [Lysinibacillus sp. OL1]
MFKKKIRKQKSRETKNIKHLLKNDYFKNHPYLKDTLEEARLCYCVGANIASLSMSVAFIEKLLKTSMGQPRNINNRDSLHNLLCSYHDNEILDNELHSEIVAIKNRRNDEIHSLTIYIEFLYTWEIEQGISARSTNAKKAMDIAEKVFNLLVLN